MKVSFVPGPSQAYPKLDEFIKDALDGEIVSMSHRSPEFAQLFKDTVAGLRKLLAVPADYHIWFLGSATEAMERIIENTVEKHSFHFINGAFAQKFYDIAQQIGRQTTSKKVDWGESFDLKSEKVPSKAELIAITQNETSTGAMIVKEQIKALRQSYPDKLLAVDVVSAAPHLELDYADVDCAFFSVQKGFGLPAGMGVLIASPKAVEKAELLAKKGLSIGSFHSFLSLKKSADKFNTPETPNVLGLYLLNRVARDMLDHGAVDLRHELDERAAKIYELLESHPYFEPQVTDTDQRSKSVIVARVLSEQDQLFEHLSSHEIIIGKGYKEQKTTHIRIANFPAHLDHIDHLIDALKMWQ